MYKLENNFVYVYNQGARKAKQFKLYYKYGLRG